MSRPPRSRTPVVTVACLLSLVTLAACSDDDATDTQAASGGTPERYVALGDSYASGLGAGAYTDSSGCARSALGYPALVAQHHGLSLTNETCAGATIPAVRAEQLDAVTDETGLVTITVGGNDLRLMAGLALCAQPGNDASCRAIFAQGAGSAREQLVPSLTELYQDVSAAAPEARVIAVGYPRLFETGSCPAEPGFSAPEREVLNEAADTLNDLISSAADEAGIDVLLPVEEFDGHGVCGEEPWIHGTAGGISGETLHPTEEGQAAYARALAEVD